ncbi:hypothetical protein Pla108_38840 [Botrimarina colliarenosi]|uniref:LamG-like jellyroll fold domain-containing protein n=1 Tax=Botrimarina colliarenosi TaxID=2528001 RepID=A0A5C6A223_9BACT|nr:LamG domain-containing protein [Botrimarina colliarenosi]TWT93390.1 hypothetical protein Pla108_38840 [Botrimarina colliarenosi]
MLRYALSLLAVLLCVVEADAANVLLVISGSSPSTEEAARKTSFEGWGHTVTTIQDNESQANFNTALAAADMAYVSGTIQPFDLLYKLREASCGVVSEVPDLDTEFGFASGDGYTDGATDVVYSVDTTHPVTSGLPSGTVSFFTSNQGSAQNGNTLASGLTTLGLGSFGMMSLGVMDSNAALANTYSGNSVAKGRRVRLPWNSVSWTALNANGQLLTQQAIAWAASGGGLIGHWKFDETSGTVAADSSGNGNDGTHVNSPTWSTNAMRGGSLRFNNSSSTDRVDAGVFDVARDITMATWVYVETLSNDSRLIIKCNGNTAATQEWGIAVDEYGALQVRIRSTGGFDWRGTATGVVTAGRWHHVAGTYDGTTMRAYVDGELINSWTHTFGGDLDVQSTRTVSLGDSSAGGRPLLGYLDDARVYDRALNDTEVRELYGLVGHWMLDESSGTTAADSSGVGNDGAYAGSATLGGSGVRGTSAAFDGSSGKVVVSPSNSLDSLESVSVGCWAKSTTSTWNENGMLVSKRDQFVLHPVINTTTIRFEVHANGSYHGLSYDVDDITSWRQYLGTYDEGTGDLKLYVDGVLVDSTNLGAETPLTADAGDFLIGHDEAHSARYFNGSMDDVVLYNRAMIPEEIAEHYGLVAHWKLDDATGTTAADSSLSGNDAPLTGTADWTNGQDGGGHAFDYTDGQDYFTAPSSEPLDDVQEDDYTVMAYYRPERVPSGTGSELAHSVLIKNGNHLGIFYNSSQQFHIDHWLAGNILAKAVTTETTYAPGRFYHVAGVVSRTNGTVQIYIDGQLVSTTNFTPGTTSREYASTPWRIGVGNPGGLYPSFGDIDDARIYNRCLSGVEIAEFVQSGLIAHWTFDEGAGTTIADVTGHGHDGAFNTGTASWVTGVRGAALEFDGANDANTDESFDPPAVGSVALWFRPNAEPSSAERLLGVANQWEIRTEADGAIYCDLAGPATGSFTTASGVAQAGGWRHLVAIYNSTEDTHQLYLDGQLVSSGGFSCDNEPAATLTFGSRTGSAERFNGALDDVRVYSYELTAAEIAEIFGLVGHWKLDETGGSVAADSSGLSRHGTYLGSPILAQSGPKPTELAAHFDGDDDVVLLPTIDDDFADGAAISAWARPTATNNFAKFLQVAEGTTKEIDLGRHGTTNSLRGIASSGSSTTSDGGLHLGVWRHYAMSINSAGEMKLFRNGALIHSATQAPPTAGPRTGNWIGGSNWPTDELFEGDLRDVRLYNRPITDEEARTLYYGESVPGLRIVRWQEVANP